jgi:hypothetical protein
MLITEYRATEGVIIELKQRLKAMSDTPGLLAKMEFEEKLRTLMGKDSKVCGTLSRSWNLREVQLSPLSLPHANRELSNGIVIRNWVKSFKLKAAITAHCRQGNNNTARTPLTAGDPSHRLNII